MAHLVIKAFFGLFSILHNSCDNLTAAALTNLVDFLPIHTKMSVMQSRM